MIYAKTALEETVSLGPRSAVAAVQPSGELQALLAEF